MSVRSSLLAILTLGPAYGFQLHVELRSRTGARRNVNVGQIYATLDRLVTQGAVGSAGLTDDGLPLYQLTRAGRIEAFNWLHDTSSAVGEEWSELLDRVLIASSLPDVDVLAIISAYRHAWSVPETPPAGTGQEQLVAAADLALAAAAVSWLDATESAITASASASASFRRELSDERPRRGRRPTHPADGSGDNQG